MYAWAIRRKSRRPIATCIMAHTHRGAFVVAHELAPARHPADGSFNHPTSWECLEARLLVDSAHDLSKRGLVEQLGAIIRSIGERCLSQGQRLRTEARTVCTPALVGSSQTHHQQSPVVFDRDVALAPNNLLVVVIARFLAYSVLASWLSSTLPDRPKSGPLVGPTFNAIELLGIPSA
jgi:hypothetical protein